MKITYHIKLPIIGSKTSVCLNLSFRWYRSKIIQTVSRSMNWKDSEVKEEVTRQHFYFYLVHTFRRPSYRLNLCRHLFVINDTPNRMGFQGGRISRVKKRGYQRTPLTREIRVKFMVKNWR